MISNNTSMPTTDDELQKNTVGSLSEGVKILVSMESKSF